MIVFPFLGLLLSGSFFFCSHQFAGSIFSADALAIKKAIIWLVLSDRRTTALELNVSQPSSMPNFYQEL